VVSLVKVSKIRLKFCNVILLELSGVVIIIIIDLIIDCYVCLIVGQWNQGGGGAAPGGEQTSTQVTIPKDVSNVIGHGWI